MKYWNFFSASKIGWNQVKSETYATKILGIAGLPYKGIEVAQSPTDSRRCIAKVILPDNVTQDQINLLDKLRAAFLSGLDFGIN